MNRLTGNSAFFRKAGSALVLAVFVLAITPKITLHNWFANHTDKTADRPASDKTQLSKAGFNCKVDDLVAEGHFIAGSHIEIINLPVAYFFPSYNLPGFTSGKVFQSKLRGPPLQF
ncbi:MAG TPA: hypothetical protein VG847_03645 [Chitinophagaceae bacterium]|nr:hypothetical protein [Chitinophagaceae bacterium]